MQNILSASVISIFALASAQAQPVATAPVPTTVAVVSGPTPQLGKIVMYRGSSVMGAGVACPIRYKEQEVVELGRGKYAEWTVPAGHYVLTNHTSSVDVAIDPGETRYVRCMIKMGMFVGRADLQIADEESFNEHRKDFEQKQVQLASVRVVPVSPQPQPPSSK